MYFILQIPKNKKSLIINSEIKMNQILTEYNHMSKELLTRFMQGLSQDYKACHFPGELTKIRHHFNREKW